MKAVKQRLDHMFDAVFILHTMLLCHATAMFSKTSARAEVYCIGAGEQYRAKQEYDFRGQSGELTGGLELSVVRR